MVSGTTQASSSSGWMPVSVQHVEVASSEHTARERRKKHGNAARKKAATTDQPYTSLLRLSPKRASQDRQLRGLRGWTIGATCAPHGRRFQVRSLTYTGGGRRVASSCGHWMFGSVPSLRVHGEQQQHSRGFAVGLVELLSSLIYTLPIVTSGHARDDIAIPAKSYGHRRAPPPTVVSAHESYNNRRLRHGRTGATSAVRVRAPCPHHGRSACLAAFATSPPADARRGAVHVFSSAVVCICREAKEEGVRGVGGGHSRGSAGQIPPLHPR